MRVAASFRPRPVRFVFSSLAAIAIAACTVGPPATDAAMPLVDARAPDSGVLAIERCGRPHAVTGAACDTAEDCDDGCFCNGAESCNAGTCRASTMPCADSAVSCVDVSCVEGLDRCVPIPNDTSCDDHDVCNGTEVCDPRAGCGPAPARLDCSDGDSCTADHCDPVMGCSWAPPDLDGDGVIDARCGGTDCDDRPIEGATVGPGRTEICGNGIDDDCDGLLDYADDACTPDYDGCGTAHPLPGPGTYTLSTRGLTDDVADGTCGAPGVDAVFSVTLASQSYLRLTLLGVSGAVSLRRASDCVAGVDLDCRADAGRLPVPAGDYVIVVSTPSAATFQLRVELLPPTTPPANDACSATGTEIGGGGRFVGALSELHDDHVISCAHRTGLVDLAYTLTLTAASDVTIDAWATAGAIPMLSSSAIAITRDCADPASEMVCVVGGDLFGEAGERAGRLTARGLAAGTYHVLVEPLTTAIASEIEVQVVPATTTPIGDTCAHAPDITTTPATVDLTAISGDDFVSCIVDTNVEVARGIDVLDAYFAFDVAATADADVHVQWTGLDSGSAGPELAVALYRGTCGSPVDELRCRHDQIETGPGALFHADRIDHFRSLAPGHYFVGVTSGHVGAGSIRASVGLSSATPPPTNDTCASPLLLTDIGVRHDTLFGLHEDFPELAGFQYTEHADAVYSFMLPTSYVFNASLVVHRDLAIDEQPNTILQVRTTCGVEASAVATANDRYGSRPTLSVTLPAGGPYYLIVYSDIADDYDLTTFVTTP